MGDMALEADVITQRAPWTDALRPQEAVGLAVPVAVESLPVGEDLLGAPGLRLLAQPLINAQESERQRIARDLHDVVGQALLAVRLSLESSRQRAHEAALSAALDESIDRVDHAIDQVRGFARDLRPAVLDDLGLVAALRWYLDRQAGAAKLEVRLETRIVGRVAPDVETACFRIVQEAMTNIIRHGRATRVWVTVVRRGDWLDLVIRDNGVGFELKRALADAIAGRSTGLVSMRERAVLTGGTLQIRTRRSGGTEIRARVPAA